MLEFAGFKVWKVRGFRSNWRGKKSRVLTYVDIQVPWQPHRVFWRIHIPLTGWERV